jgi:PIN domain nuclease of toxin-antitoxin system
MRLLLDTHALLWFYFTDPKLSPTARMAIETAGNVILVSPASYWEVAIKVSQGKLGLREPFPDFVQHAVFDNGFVILPVEPRHTAALIGLPFHHRDPFDRLLVAQAIVENVPLITCDPDLMPYPITRIW